MHHPDDFSRCVFIMKDPCTKCGRTYEAWMEMKLVREVADQITEDVSRGLHPYITAETVVAKVTEARKEMAR